MTRAAAKASEAAEALLAWLDRQSPRPIAGSESPPDHFPGDDRVGAAGAIASMPDPTPSTAPGDGDDGEKTAGQGRQRGEPAERGYADLGSGGKRLAHPDWLAHRLTVTGPAAELVAFREAAAGAGSIPWQLDFDRLEEDFFLRLAAPPPPQVRTLSLDGARILAEQLRAAVAQRHALAVARVGQSKACPFDLHALLPVPEEILARGPDHPASIAWLWRHWGTPEALRYVVDVTPPDDQKRPAGDRLVLSFWSADWSPWAALLRIRQLWPALQFDLCPRYELA